MTTVANIIYVSRKVADTMAPGVQQLFLYDSNNNLIWVGTRTTTATAHGAINPSEWDAGSWTVVFTKGYYVPGEMTDGVPADTTTASVTATVTRYTGTADGYIIFTYDGQMYRASLTDYQYDTAAYPLENVSGYTPYYIYTPYSPSDTSAPAYSATDVRAAYPISSWYKEDPTVSATTVSPGTSIDVAWSAPSPTYYGSGTASVTTSTVILYVSTNSDMSGATTYELSGTSGTKSLTGLTEDRTYYFKVAATYATSNGETIYGISELAQANTVKPLDTPTINGVSALDGAGSATWTAVANAVSYEYGVTDDAATPPVSGTSISGTTWTFDDATLKGKFLFVRAIADSSQFVYSNSKWQRQGAEIPATESGGDPEVEPTTAILNRRIYKAIPYIDVPVEQIGLGGNVKDVITVEYADNRYLRSDGEGGTIIPTTSLPWAVYGTTSDESTDTVINPAYLKSAITALDLAYDITEIAISSSSSTTFAGVTADIATASADSGLASETYLIPTTKAVYDFVTAPGNLPKAKSAGGASNAGIVYISAAQGENGHGLTISGQNDGLLEVNFATFSTWNTTSPYTVVNPSYVKAVIEELGLNKSASTYSTSNNYQSGYFVKLASDGKINPKLLPDISLTKTVVDTTARTYGSGAGYTYATRQAAIEALLSSHTNDVQEGDFIIVSPSVTSTTSEYTLQGTFVVTESGDPAVKSLVEINTPEWAVTSVNGQTGIITQAELGLVTSIRAAATATDTNFPSEKAVRTELNTLDSNKLNTSDFSTTLAGYYSNATTVAGLADDDYIVIGANLADILGDFETSLGLGTAATYGVASSIADNESGLVTGDQVYDYAAPVSHTHSLGEIIYSGSTGYSAGTSISSESTDGELATAEAVYDYQPLITRIQAVSGTNFSATTTNLSTAIASENYSIPTAYAVQQYVTGYSVPASQLPTATWTAGTSDWTDTGTGIVNLSYLAAALADYDNDLTVASSKVSGIQTVSDPSVSSTFGQVVKTESNWGQISASLIPIDDYSITLLSGTTLQVSTSWLHSTLDSRYLKAGDAQTGYIRMANTDASAWTSGASYAVGDLVYATNGMLWRCIQANTAATANGPNGINNTDTGGNYVYWMPAQVGIERRYETTIYGDGSTTEFTISHKLGTRFVQVTLADSSGNEVYAAVSFLSTSQVQIGFGNPPASGTQYSVVVRA